MKKIIVILVLSFLLVSCGTLNQNNSETFKITASIIPLASISNYIGGDLVESISIIPAGISPHSFDLKVNDVKSIENSNLLIYLGLEHIDGFLAKVVENKNIINVSEKINFIDGVDNHDEEIDSHEEDIHSIDPHVWTSAKNAKLIGREITNELIKTFPSKEEELLENLSSFENELDNLLGDFKNNVSGKTQNSFIIFHDAYNYLFEELGIKDENKIVFQKSVLSEMSIVDMKELTDIVRANNIKYIFKEPQFENSNLIKFAEENELIILELDPIGVNIDYGGFITNYGNNLKNLENIYE